MGISRRDAIVAKRPAALSCGAFKSNEEGAEKGPTKGIRDMIIMLCRNNVELSKQCLDTLIKQELGCEILIFDNASMDGTAKCASARFPATWKVSVSCQLSVAAAWNWALDWAFNNRNYKEALVVNNDTELRLDTYATLKHHLNASGAGMMTCVSVRERERMQGNFELSADGYRPHPDFSCFMISKACYERVGPFDERYEIAYAEDADYHVRMHRAGVKALNCGLPFLHHGSQTVKRADEAERQRICTQADKNRQLFFNTYGARIGTDSYSTLFTAESFGRAVDSTHPELSALERVRQ